MINTVLRFVNLIKKKSKHDNDENRFKRFVRLVRIRSINYFSLKLNNQILTI